MSLKLELVDCLNKKEKLVYISGKITGIEDLNIKKFLECEQMLVKNGFKVINPHNLTHGVNTTGWEWDDYMSICIPYVMLSNTIICLDDWQDSKGARIEIGLAYFMKKKILSAKNMQELDYHFELKPIHKSFLRGR